MRFSLRSVYQQLPIVRELRAVQDSLFRLADLVKRVAERQCNRKLLETAAVIQALESIKSSDPRYKDSRRLLAHGSQYWSQNYEDGMIEEIFRRLPPATRTFLEIGVGDGSENNTTALLAAGWRGWWMDGDARGCAAIRERLAEMPSMAGRLTLRETLVSPANIRALLQELQVPSEVDLFSLDIDQDTYHIWEALEGFRPRVVVVEYNGAMPPGMPWIHPYQTGRMWNGTQAFGASLKSFEMLGRRHGYSLVGCDLLGVNAFFVRDDLVGDNFAAPFTAENHYEPPRYGLVFRWGHGASFYGESQSH